MKNHATAKTANCLFLAILSSLIVKSTCLADAANRLQTTDASGEFQGFDLFSSSMSTTIQRISSPRSLRCASTNRLDYMTLNTRYPWTAEWSSHETEINAETSSEIGQQICQSRPIFFLMDASASVYQTHQQASETEELVRTTDMIDSDNCSVVNQMVLQETYMKRFHEAFQYADISTGRLPDSYFYIPYASGSLVYARTAREDEKDLSFATFIQQVESFKDLSTRTLIYQFFFGRNRGYSSASKALRQTTDILNDPSSSLLTTELGGSTAAPIIILMTQGIPSSILGAAVERDRREREAQSLQETYSAHIHCLFFSLDNDTAAADFWEEESVCNSKQIFKSPLDINSESISNGLSYLQDRKELCQNLSLHANETNSSTPPPTQANQGEAFFATDLNFSQSTVILNNLNGRCYPIERAPSAFPTTIDCIENETEEALVYSNITHYEDQSISLRLRTLSPYESVPVNGKFERWGIFFVEASTSITIELDFLQAQSHLSEPQGDPRPVVLPMTHFSIFAITETSCCGCENCSPSVSVNLDQLTQPSEASLGANMTELTAQETSVPSDKRSSLVVFQDPWSELSETYDYGQVHPTNTSLSSKRVTYRLSGEKGGISGEHLGATLEERGFGLTFQLENSSTFQVTLAIETALPVGSSESQQEAENGTWYRAFLFGGRSSLVPLLD